MGIESTFSLMPEGASEAYVCFMEKLVEAVQNLQDIDSEIRIAYISEKPQTIVPEIYSLVKVDGIGLLDTEVMFAIENSRSVLPGTRDTFYTTAYISDASMENKRNPNSNYNTIVSLLTKFAEEQNFQKIILKEFEVPYKVPEITIDKFTS